MAICFSAPKTWELVWNAVSQVWPFHMGLLARYPGVFWPSGHYAVFAHTSARAAVGLHLRLGTTRHTGPASMWFIPALAKTASSMIGSTLWSTNWHHYRGWVEQSYHRPSDAGNYHIFQNISCNFTKRKNFFMSHLILHLWHCPLTYYCRCGL